MFMSTQRREKYIRWTIRFIAIELWIFTAKATVGVIVLLSQSALTNDLLFFGVPLMRPYAWEYETMIASIYIVWATYLWRASKNPERQTALINFTIWANLLHGSVMIIQAIIHDHEVYRLLFDSATLLIPPIILLSLRFHDFTASKKNDGSMANF